VKWNKDLGGGSPALRRQLGILLKFVNGLDLVNMKPESRILRRAPEGSVALSSPGWQAAVYLDGETKDPVMLDLPAGPYRAEWRDTKTGHLVKTEHIRHSGGEVSLLPPLYSEDIALKVSRSDGRRPAAARRQPPSKNPPNLFRAINLGGGALVIDGILWEAGHAGVVTYEGSAFEDQKVPLIPPAGEARADMIRSSIWDPRGSNLLLTGVPPGEYDCYLTVWEDNDTQTFDIALNGRTVRKGYTSGAAGHWQRLGPWPVTVTDAIIKLRTTGGHANLSGFEVWRRGAGRAPVNPPNPAARPVSRGTDVRVSRNGRYLERTNGRPFLWLGDTAWLLSQMTTREDVDLYLQTRDRQGFTLVQAAAVMGEERVGGTLRPNKYGARAFIVNNGNTSALRRMAGRWLQIS
jgi:hypothetical protein